jgi:capsular exopolysaccharide synthesis family protein
LEIKDYIRFVARWWWLLAIAAALGAIGAYMLTSRETPIYAAATKLLVNQNQGQFANPTTTFDDLRTRERLARTYMELLRARPVMERAIELLGITMDPRSLAGKLSIVALNDTELIQLTVRDPDPRRAEQLADAIAMAFQELERDLLSNPFAAGSSLVVIETAQASGTPVSPNVSRSMLIAAVLGLFLAILIGFLRDFFDDSMGGGGDLQRRTGFTQVATIGTIGGANKLITLRDPYSPTAEAYRLFRTQIDAFPLDRPLQTLVVTSPIPRDGKSVTAANLAVAIAQTGRSVILVDANLREPQLHTLFGQENTTGLAHLLTHGGASGVIGTYLRPTNVERLRLLPAGASEAHPSQLLGSEHLAGLIASLKAEAELIIFDTPALLSVVDAALILRAADAALLVVGAGVSRGADVRRAYSDLQQLNVNMLGILLNKVRLPMGVGRLRSGRLGRQRPSAEPTRLGQEGESFKLRT